MVTQAVARHFAIGRVARDRRSGSTMRERALPAEPVSDGLAQLARVEERLAREVAAARAAAAAEVEEARRTVEAEAEARRERHAAALAALHAKAALRRERRVRALRRRSARRRAGWERVSEGRLAEAAAELVSSLVEELARRGGDEVVRGGGARSDAMPREAATP